MGLSQDKLDKWGHETGNRDKIEHLLCGLIMKERIVYRDYIIFIHTALEEHRVDLWDFGLHSTR